MTLSLRRGPAVGLVLLCAAALLVTTMPTWATAQAGTSVGTVPVAVSGSTASPGTTAAALLALVSGLVLALAGRAARVLALVGIAAAGALSVVATVRFLADPAPMLESAAAVATGVDRLAAAPLTTAAPVIAVVVSGLLIVLAALVLAFSAPWQQVGRRYRTDAAAATESGANERPGRRAMNDWDALTRGDDPTLAAGDGTENQP